VIIASADKNLSPKGVDTEDYIKMGLDHLLDPLAYTLLTEEQAAEDIDKLWADIFSWTISHRQSLSNDAVNFIRKHLEDCWYIAVDTLSTLGSLFSSFPPYQVVRDSGT